MPFTKAMLIDNLNTLLKEQLENWGAGHLTNPLIARVADLLTRLEANPDLVDNNTINDSEKLLEISKENEKLKIENLRLKTAENLNSAKILQDFELIQEELSKTKELLENRTKIARDREEEVNRLYNLTESDPKFRIYYIVRDASPEWINFEDIYRYTSLPASKVRKHLETFRLRGLLDIEGNRARVRNMIRRTSNHLE